MSTTAFIVLIRKTVDRVSATNYQRGESHNCADKNIVHFSIDAVAPKLKENELQLLLVLKYYFH